MMRTIGYKITHNVPQVGICFNSAYLLLLAVLKGEDMKGLKTQYQQGYADAIKGRPFGKSMNSEWVTRQYIAGYERGVYLEKKIKPPLVIQKLNCN